jgi:hypothetical protein
MIKIGSGFAFPATMDLRILDTLPVHVHKYGSPQPSVSNFMWMEYNNEGFHTGRISFCRNIGTHWPEAAYHVIEYLSSLLPDWPLDPNRVAFMRTYGNIAPHRDEGGRLCCINIGIRDSDVAVTRVSLDDDFDTFDREYEDHTVNDGCSYLLDVSRVHAVYQTSLGNRLLISYGFGVPAERVLSHLTARKT